MHLIKNKRNLMFGLSIKLDHYLGTIHQPTLKDIIEYDIKEEDIWFPFAIDKNLCLDKCSIFETLLILHISKQDKQIMDSLKKSLMILYKTEDVELNINTQTIVIDKKYTLNADNFDYLCKNVADIFMLNLFQIQKKYDEVRAENSRPKTEAEKQLEILRRRSMQRRKNKQSEFDLIDMSNYLIHSSGKYTYENVLNMTVWQIKNSFNLYNKKENFDMEKRYRTSGNFDMGKEKMKHWFFKDQ